MTLLAFGIRYLTLRGIEWIHVWWQMMDLECFSCFYEVSAFSSLVGGWQRCCQSSLRIDTKPDDVFVRFSVSSFCWFSLSPHGWYMYIHEHPHISSHRPLKTSSHPAVHIHVSPILTFCIVENLSEVVPSFTLGRGAAWLFGRLRCFLDSVLMSISLEMRRDCRGKIISSSCRMPWSCVWWCREVRTSDLRCMPWVCCSTRVVAWRTECSLTMEQDGSCKETSKNAGTEQLVLYLYTACWRPLLLAVQRSSWMIAFGRIRERFSKTAGVAKLSDVFQFQWTSPDSLEDRWLKWQRLMRRVNMTSLCDDARDTLMIAGLEKAKERARQQHFRLRAPQTWTVLCARVDQYLRTTVDSGSPPTPMEIGAEVSTCACCGKPGHEKTRCRFRNAKSSNCGEARHPRAMCRQRASQVPPAAVARVMAKAVRDVLVGTQLRRKEKFNTCGHCQSMIFLDYSLTLCLFSTTPISRLTILGTC